MFLTQKENPELLLESCRKASACDAGPPHRAREGTAQPLC